eukprot:CAMPEP_0119310788 /NCGR_PEP_ID=MMETSP1333-20130426/20195_1 /TAXON_ID=418940 /ORGANISM="Scyphosphaera apsteinii, Strain RCC1455" /LENGTH=217 /DNA_ID=CAMNT_0007315033 /DNA_START=57 /DNA_END=710 /DNA_ORIENTATION=-
MAMVLGIYANQEAYVTEYSDSSCNNIKKSVSCSTEYCSSTDCIGSLYLSSVASSGSYKVDCNTDGNTFTLYKYSSSSAGGVNSDCSTSTNTFSFSSTGVETPEYGKKENECFNSGMADSNGYAVFLKIECKDPWDQIGKDVEKAAGIATGVIAALIIVPILVCCCCIGLIVFCVVKSNKKSKAATTPAPTQQAQPVAVAVATPAQPVQPVAQPVYST